MGYSHQALLESRECVLAVPAFDLAEKVVDIGNCSVDTVKKFERFDLTPIAATTVNAPLARECWANLECRIADDGWSHRCNLLVLEVQRTRVDDTRQENGSSTIRAMAASASTGRLLIGRI